MAYLNQAGYAPKYIDHIHDVLSAVLRTAVKWGHLQTNPARDVDMPTLKTVRPKWVLTTDQAAQLLDVLPPLGRTMAELRCSRASGAENSLRCAGTTSTSTDACSLFARQCTKAASTSRKRLPAFGRFRFPTAP
jgi:hypothetical protein